jgi:hypothetical protein
MGFGTAEMKGVKVSTVGVGSVLLLLFLANTVEGRLSFGISVGIPFVYHNPGFHYGCYPSYGWHTGYYRWSDAGRYRSIRYFRPSYPYRGRSLCSSELGIWIGNCLPIVIDPPPVTVHSEVVARPGDHRCGTTPDGDTAEQLEKLKQKKNELLKVLRIGDKERRLRAIRDLAGLSCDDTVRKALEKVLLSDPDPELRKEVATSFGKTENRKVVAALEEAKATDSSREVRQAAYRAIILIKGY